MSYQVLARKWRPKNFSDVIGQEHVLKALKNSLLLGRIHHAWLFSGTKGIGKTSIARLLTKSLNCKSGITVNPCGICDHCREIEQMRFVDFIEVDAASHTKVEDTRDLLDNIQYAPIRGRFKIYLIDEVHMLSRHSFNALLKVLEEPPSHVKFLLATTDPQKLPITILSRCLQFHLKLLDVEQICSRLEYILNEENIRYDVEALKLLANASEGSLRDALNLTDQAISAGNGILMTDTVSSMLGVLDKSQALSLIKAIIRADGKLTMLLVNNMASHGIRWEALLIEMQNLLHHIAMIQFLSNSSNIAKTDMTTNEHQLHLLARNLSPTDIQFYYQTLLTGRKELPFAPNQRMGVEMTLLRALAFHPKKSLSKSKITKPELFASNSKEIVPFSIPQQPQQKTLSENKDLLSEATDKILIARNQLRYKKKK